MATMYKTSDCRFYHQIKKFLIFFFFMGQSPVSTFSNINQCYAKIPSILSIVVVSCLSIFCIYTHYNTVTELGDENEITSYAGLFIEQITNMIIVSQCFIHKNALNITINHFRFLSNFFRSRFNHETSPKNDVYWTIWSISTILLFYTCEVIFICTIKFFNVLWDISVVDIISLMMGATLIIATTHSLLYINWIAFYVVELNLIIQKNSKCCSCQLNFSSQQFSSSLWTVEYRCHGCDEIRSMKLRNSKLIYYRIWRITQSVNDFFGLSIVSIILRNFTDASVSLYWVYIMLISDKSLIHAVGPLIQLFTPIITTTFLINSAQRLCDQVYFLFDKKFFKYVTANCFLYSHN